MCLFPVSSLHLAPVSLSLVQKRWEKTTLQSIFSLSWTMKNWTFMKRNPIPHAFDWGIGHLRPQKVHTSYLSFFDTCKIFGEWNLHRKMRKLRQTVWYCLEGVNSLHSKLPIFRVKSVKIYTGQFFLHRHRLWCLWQIWGMKKLFFRNSVYSTIIAYLIFVTGTTGAACVKKIARCKFLQI